MPAKPKAPADETADAPKSGGSKATGIYTNPGNVSVPVIARPAQDGLVDLFREDGSEPFCTGCRISATPAEGCYTPH